jgi:hypothetical protein
LIANGNRRIRNTETDWPYPSPLLISEHIFGGIGGPPTGVSLPSGQQGVDKYQTCGNNRPSKLLLVVSCCLVVFSFALLSKVVTKINLAPSCNDNVLIAGFFAALGIFLVSGWLILWWFGLAPFDVFGHEL